MAQITVAINGRNYHIQSADGEEAHVLELGRYVDGRVRELAQAAGSSPDQQLLAMMTLILADELSEAVDEIHKTAQRVEDLTARLAGGMIGSVPGR